MRIGLIHALTHSMPAIAAAFARDWPEATLANLLDDSLSSDLAREGALTPAMTERFLTLARYAARCGADAILFTCSAFGPCIDACARDLAPLPVLKPNEAMIEEAVALAGPAARIGLLASFAPTLQSMPAEFAAVAPRATVVPCLAGNALAALDRGDPDGHDRAAAEAATALRDCDLIALGQFSLARAAPAVAAATGKTVLTTPESAVRKLQRLLIPQQRQPAMTLDEFRASVAADAPPDHLGYALQTLWWDAKGDWHRAHHCAQQDRERTGSSVHAYLHRKEGDMSNAAGWYSRAGRTPPTVSLDAEWQALANELLGA